MISGGMKNKKSDSFMEEFKHKAEITADEFWRIWNKFDEDGLFCGFRSRIYDGGLIFGQSCFRITSRHFFTRF